MQCKLKQTAAMGLYDAAEMQFVIPCMLERNTIEYNEKLGTKKKNISCCVISRHNIDLASYKSTDLVMKYF